MTAIKACASSNTFPLGMGPQAVQELDYLALDNTE
jgi:hypothetical protein